MQSIITCPFCFMDFPPQKIKFRCDNLECAGKAPDPIYTSYRNLPEQDMGYVLIPPWRPSDLMSNAMKCNVCEKMSYTRLCPHCHFELPSDIGQNEQYIIAIIGGRGTGKSHYIASLIHRLQTEIGQQFKVSVQMMGESTEERWESEFNQPLFVRKETIPQTRTAKVNQSVRSPLMFSFKFIRGKRKRVLTVSFFDSAGEDMTELSNNDVLNRYICHAHGIIFLLDPLQIPQVRQQLPKSAQNVALALPPPNWKSAPERIVADLRRLFQKEYNLQSKQTITVPIAFTLSKIDMLKPILDPGSALLDQSFHPGFVDLKDLQTVDTQVKTSLSEWINPAFITGIQSEFDYYKFFGVSALGEQPDASGHLRKVNPLRVEDPFLWLLSVIELVDKKK